MVIFSKRHKLIFGNFCVFVLGVSVFCDLTVNLFEFVIHEHIVFVTVWSGAPACYAQSVFTNIFGHRGGTHAAFSCEDYDCHDNEHNFDDENLF